MTACSRPESALEREWLAKGREASPLQTSRRRLVTISSCSGAAVSTQARPPTTKSGGRTGDHVGTRERLAPRLALAKIDGGGRMITSARANADGHVERSRMDLHIGDWQAPTITSIAERATRTRSRCRSPGCQLDSSDRVGLLSARGAITNHPCDPGADLIAPCRVAVEGDAHYLAPVESSVGRIAAISGHPVDTRPERTISPKRKRAIDVAVRENSPHATSIDAGGAVPATAARKRRPQNAVAR